MAYTSTSSGSGPRPGVCLFGKPLPPIPGNPKRFGYGWGKAPALRNRLQVQGLGGQGVLTLHLRGPCNPGSGGLSHFRGGCSCTCATGCGGCRNKCFTALPKPRVMSGPSGGHSGTCCWRNCPEVGLQGCLCEEFPN